MLYLEDYLELIEQLPQDLRDRFTDMRELDLKVQNASDMLDSSVQKLFSNGPKVPQDARDDEYKAIRENFGKVIEDADEKVNMASQLYDLVERYLRKLNQELSKFKMELEADCAGVTEELERRSLLNDESMLDVSLYAMQSSLNLSPLDGHRRKLTSQRSFIQSNGLPPVREPKPFTPKTSSTYSNPVTPLPRPISPSASPSSSMSYNIGQVGAAGSVALAVAAAQAVNTTLQQQHGRRGVQASLKANYATAMKAEQLVCDDLLGTTSSHVPKANPYVDVMNTSAFPSNIVTSNRPPVSPLMPAPPSKQLDVTTTPSPNPSKLGRKRQHKSSAPLPASYPHPSGLHPPEAGGAEPTLDWVPDPNEPLYCLCNQVSYGEMVGCDNGDCPIEWFHYGCVGLTDAPKGKWYCPKCRPEMKKRKQR